MERENQADASEAGLVRELEAMRRERDEIRARQQATVEILRAIANAPGEAESLRRIAEITERLFGASSVSLLVADGDRWGLTLRVGAGSERINTAIPLAHVAITSRFMPGAVYLENRQVHVPDIDDPDAVARWPGVTPARAAGTRTLVGTPLRREGRAIGALIVHRDRLAPFTDDELELLQSFADQAAIAAENTRLIKETREALERQTATADVLKVIASSPSELQPVFDAIAERSNKLIGGFSTAVLRLQGDIVHLAAFTSTGEAGDRALQALFPLPAVELPTVAMVRSGEAAQFVDTEAETGVPLAIRDLARLRGFRSMLFAPLMSQGEPIGIISVTRTDPGVFDPGHVKLLKTFADQAVIAIENTRLFDEVQSKTRGLEEALQQQTATADVLKVISRSAFDLQMVLETLIRSAVELSGARRGSIFLRDGELFRFRAASQADLHPEWIRFLKENPQKAGRHSAIGQAISGGRTVCVPDVLADPEIKMPATLAGIRAVLAVPLLRDGKVEGVMALSRETPGPFSARQIELVETFADQAVIAIENVRLFDEVQARTRELSRSLDELRTAQDRLIQTEKLASLGQLTAGIAHEIKNPLNFVNNFSSLSIELIEELLDVLSKAPLDAVARGDVDELTHMLKGNLDKVVQHGKRADSIVKNMLLHSREGSGERQPTDINALVEEGLNLAYHGARAEKSGFNITLRRDFDPAAGVADLYPQEITRVLLNLISNGFHAATKRRLDEGDGFAPELAAATRDLGGQIEIRIRDNGTGIAPEVKEKMFDPFFTTKPAGEGTGLGLSMSHDIVVKQHGGTIAVETEPNVFTEFIITLPRAVAMPQTGGRT